MERSECLSGSKLSQHDAFQWTARSTESQAVRILSAIAQPFDAESMPSGSVLVLHASHTQFLRS